MSASEPDPLRSALVELRSARRPRVPRGARADDVYEPPVQALRLAAARLIGDLDQPPAPEPPDFPSAA